MLSRGLVLTANKDTRGWEETVAEAIFWNEVGWSFETGGHLTSNPDVERTQGGRNPEQNPTGGNSRCPWRDMPLDLLVSVELSQKGRHLKR